MARVVPEAVQEDARAAAALAREVAAGRDAAAGAAARLADAGLLDEALPWVVRAEVARAVGAAAGCSAGLAAFGTTPVLAAAVLCGAAETLAETGMAYARDRVVFGRPLARMPVQRYAFATVAASVEAAVALVRRVASALDDTDDTDDTDDADDGGAAEADVAAVLPYALDAAWAAAEAALQVHGGYGYSDEYPVSGMWREVAAARAALRR